MMAGWNVDAMTIGDANVIGLEIAADADAGGLSAAAR